jgi:hypothetical protein
MICAIYLYFYTNQVFCREHIENAITWSCAFNCIYCNKLGLKGEFTFSALDRMNEHGKYPELLVFHAILPLFFEFSQMATRMARAPFRKR